MSEETEAPKSLDALEQSLGERHLLDFDPIEDQEVPEEWEPEESTELEYNEIAEIAYNAVTMYKNMMWPKQVTPLYEELSDADKEHLKLEVEEVMKTAHDPNDQAIARVKYAQVAMQKLSEGYYYSKEEGPEGSPEVVPWEYLPNHYKMPYFLFRDVALRLVRSVWNGR